MKYVGLILLLWIGGVLPSWAQTEVKSGKTLDFSEATFDITVESGGTLKQSSLSANYGTVNDTVTISGTGVNGVGALYSTCNTSYGIQAKVEVKDSATVGINAGGGRLRFFGEVTGGILTTSATGTGGIPLVNFGVTSKANLTQLNIAKGVTTFTGTNATGVQTHTFTNGVTVANGATLELFEAEKGITFVKNDTGDLATVTFSGGVLKNSSTSNFTADLNIASDSTYENAYGKLTLQGGSISGAGTFKVTGDLDFSGTTLAEATINQTNGTFNLANINVSENSTLSGNINSFTGTNTLATGKTLTFQNANSTISGQLTGEGGLIVNGGTVTLSSANTYTGETVVQGGKLIFGKSIVGTTEQTSMTSKITVNSGGILQFSTTNAFGTRNGCYVPDIELNGGTLHGLANLYANIGNITLNNGATVTSENNNGSYYFYSAINASGNASISAPQIAVRQYYNSNTPNEDHGKITVDQDGVLTISSNVFLEGNATTGGIFKFGKGTLDISGRVTGDGVLTVNEGTVALSNVNTYSGATTVESGAELKLTGTINNSALTVRGGGTLLGTGSAKSLELQKGASLVLDLESAAKGSILSVTGAITLDETLISFEAYEDYMSLFGKNVTLLSGDSLTAALENLTFDFSNIGGNIWIPQLTGNALVLSMDTAAVPEPASWLLLLGLLFLGISQRKRVRR
ncbi:MAG: PEP-CTERM sorting domain-containing protein [Planctomycetia bacterium]|nr:PEP-CTERM sorting domain-containing protein [Planctomycetia bacterium]